MSTDPVSSPFAADPLAATPSEPPLPFLGFAGPATPQTLSRAAITAMTRRAEPACIAALLEAARLSPEQCEAAQRQAAGLALRLREQGARAGREGLLQSMLHEFSLSSNEGVALMCLAEALLRIPDVATRDALIRDKIGATDWQSHLGHSRSLFVDAATWGLLLTGRLLAPHDEAGLGPALGRALARSGEPLIRHAVDLSMRLMGEQFVAGETIREALANARPREAEGFRHSYDMLGEAAMTAADAERYAQAYRQAIDAIGHAAGGRGIHEGPGISIKLSALHPRYSRSQRERVIDELYPRLAALALQARGHDIGLNIDAEEADRLELSVDLLERLCAEPGLAGWDGIGFVAQAYQKRCPALIEHLIDLARRSRRRLMLRLVKGAYWDSEIKHAQEGGFDDYPVYTRKVHTDLAYLACARQLLAAPEAIFPQFATHNAHTLAAVVQMAGADFHPGQYEFQCLHGMGEPLHAQVVAPPSLGGLGRPSRIYAPVGSHVTLLAYLVRRLLENGANSSFVHRIADEQVSIADLVADPVASVERAAQQEGTLGLPHPAIALPRALYRGARINSTGADLSDEHRLTALSQSLLASAGHRWQAQPLLDGVAPTGGEARPVHNPADRRDLVGSVVEAEPADAAAAVAASVAAAPAWQAVFPDERAGRLERAADLLQAQGDSLVGLLIRESGKTAANAVAELREAIDALRYYAAEARSLDAATPARGPVVCISPWNFPLAIFIGQLAAALAAGNPVLAKPARQTPLIAAQAVRLLHLAGIPRGALQLLPGRGDGIGAALVADLRIRGVVFTGSIAVAQGLQRTLAGRLDEHGRPLLLIAETGGQNAMIVDSSALAEQVVADVLASAFDSAGQRCSALRVLCLQEDIADRVLTMLDGALCELRVGRPDRLSTDIGPLIDAAALRSVESHVDAMRAQGRRVRQYGRAAAQPAWQFGSFAAPTLIEIDRFDRLEREVFGPVLHILRWPRSGLGELVAQINASGFALTLGIHSRIDATVDFIVERARAGNIYVNRNLIGAVVGVQPFGGSGLSGTGPKAGGPLYLRRLGSGNALRWPLPPLDAASASRRAEQLVPLGELGRWAARVGRASLAACCQGLAERSPLGMELQLDGPTGERNRYRLSARDAVLCIAGDESDRLFQLAWVLAAGAHARLGRRCGAAAAAACRAAARRAPARARDARPAGSRIRCRADPGRPGRSRRLESAPGCPRRPDRRPAGRAGRRRRRGRVFARPPAGRAHRLGQRHRRGRQRQPVGDWLHRAGRGAASYGKRVPASHFGGQAQ